VSLDPETATAKEPLRVLLIDDHTLFRSGLQELLERRGIKVVAATGDGREGGRLAAEHKPNVVLLDLRMPEIDGLAVLQALNDLALGIPVVMLTTSSDERDLVASHSSGAPG
jgi:two-component system nitrate/nitrite response regulator NarL